MHGRVRRALQPFNRPPSGGAERQQNRREPLARTGALFDRQRLGQRTDEDFAERHAHRLDALELRRVYRGEVRRDVAHHRAGDEHVDRGDRMLAAPRRRAGAPFADEYLDQLHRGVEIADEQQIFEEPHDRRHHLAPLRVVRLDPQQIQQQRQVERPKLSGRDGAEPCGNALGRIVVDLLDFDGLRPRARQLARVLVPDERFVRIRRQELPGDMVPDRFEAFRAAERRCLHVLVRQREQPRPLLRILHERLERDGEAIGGRRFLDDVSRDEARNRAVGHAADHRVHQLRPLVDLALLEQPHEHFRRQPADRRRHVPQHRLEAIGIGFRHRVDDAAEHPHQRRGLRADPARIGRALFHRGHQVRQAIGVTGDPEQLLDRRLVEIESHALQAIGEHLVPHGRLAARALAQHFGVVDLAQLDVPSRHRRPHARDAAVGANRLGRPREQKQEAAPGVGIAAGIDRQLADQVAMQQRGQFADRRFRARQRAFVEQQRLGENRQPKRRVQRGYRRDLHDSTERRGDRRMPGWIEHDRPRRGLAGACEFDETRCMLGSQRGWLFAHRYFNGSMPNGSGSSASTTARSSSSP